MSKWCVNDIRINVSIMYLRLFIQFIHSCTAHPLSSYNFSHFIVHLSFSSRLKHQRKWLKRKRRRRNCNNAIKIVSNRYTRWEFAYIEDCIIRVFLTHSTAHNPPFFFHCVFLSVPYTVMIVTWKIDYNRKISHGRLEQMNTKRDCNYEMYVHEKNEEYQK